MSAPSQSYKDPTTRGKGLLGMGKKKTQKAAIETSDAANAPYKLGGADNVSIGFTEVPEVGTLILQWATVAYTQVKNEFILLTFPDWEVILEMNFKKSEALKWTVGALVEGIHNQKLAWVTHSDELGISITITSTEEEEGEEEKK